MILYDEPVFALMWMFTFPQSNTHKSGMWFLNLNHFIFRNYQNWAPAEPRSGNDCAAIQLADGKWVSDSCNAQKAYACAVPPIPLSTCPPPTTPVRKLFRKTFFRSFY